MILYVTVYDTVSAGLSLNILYDSSALDRVT